VALVGIQLTIWTNKKQKPTNKDISEHDNMYRTNTFTAMIIYWEGSIINGFPEKTCETN
jgi:hypothetical protein